MERNHHNESELPQDFDVEEITPDANDEQDPIYAGTVERWQILEFAEKAKVRPYITGAIISVWTIGMIASAARLLITGNFLLVIPPTLISLPLYIVLKFYFRSG